MFTEAERLRAIELYFKYGRKLAPVVRKLSYPSKRNLRRWSRLGSSATWVEIFMPEDLSPDASVTRTLPDHTRPSGTPCVF